MRENFQIVEFFIKNILIANSTIWRNIHSDNKKSDFGYF